jgi:hypothetical protein
MSSHLKVVSIAPVKGLSELDRQGCQRLCMEWYTLDLDGESYVAFTSAERPTWNYYLKRTSSGWYVEHQPDDVVRIVVTKGHATARAACGAAGYHFRCQLNHMLANADTVSAWWWEHHSTPLMDDEPETPQVNVASGSATITFGASGTIVQGSATLKGKAKVNSTAC